VESRQEEPEDAASSDTSADATEHIESKSEDTNILSENTSDVWKHTKNNTEKSWETWEEVWWEKSDVTEEWSPKFSEDIEDISEEEFAEFVVHTEKKSESWEEESWTWEEDMEEEQEHWESESEDKETCLKESTDVQEEQSEFQEEESEDATKKWEESSEESSEPKKQSKNT
jgi:hypothetical protein